VLSRRPAVTEGRAVLVVPPFAEEMNKSRRMITQVAQQLSARGVATVIPDLFGTGDSAGEFGDGDWDVWKDDLRRAMEWSLRSGWRVARMLCTRLGCALAAETARDAGMSLEGTVFWQPVPDGQQFLNQFLRLRVAASMNMEDRRESVAGLREQLHGGKSLEVAGYEISPWLADQLDQIRLGSAIGPWLGELTWMEVVRACDAPIPRRSEEIIKGALARGLTVTVKTVNGVPFWASTEIVSLPDLIAGTVDALSPITRARSEQQPAGGLAEAAG